MDQRRYSDDEKRCVIRDFLLERNMAGISLRKFSSQREIPYYTLRDWYRDFRFNPEWNKRYEFSTQDNAVKKVVNEEMCFVLIGKS